MDVQCIYQRATLTLFFFRLKATLTLNKLEKLNTFM